MLDAPQPLRLSYGTLVFEGRVYSCDTEGSSARFISEKLNESRRNVEAFIKDFDGSFAFALAELGGLVVGRDCLGTHPLYYGENSDVIAFASERKALWKIGVEKVHPFPAGHLANIDKYGFRFKHVKTLAYRETKHTTIQAAAKNLKRLLQQSVSRGLETSEEISLAFSGGLDSSIIAQVAKNLGADIDLVFVSLEKQAEIEHAKKAAEALELPFHIQLYEEKEVEKDLRKVLWLIEESNPVQASIAIPVFWIAENASKTGFSVLLAGQGADELFAGYERYLSDYVNYGPEYTRKKIFDDVKNMCKTNFERDSKICSYHNLELRLPFATCDLAEFALSLPLHLKIAPSRNRLRKIVLRRLAKDIGLPDFIVEKPKKAIQYGTGVNNVLKKLAKTAGYSADEYLQREFEQVFEE